MTEWQNRTSCVSLITIFLYTIFSPSQCKSFSPEKYPQKSPCILTPDDEFFTYIRLWNPQNILQIVQCILWSTQHRTYNSACDQQIINYCFYCWHIPIILACSISTKENCTADPVSFMTSQSQRIAYPTADEDLAIVSMVTYRTPVPARMSVLCVFLFQKESA
jgi:hypothetical protein